MNASRNRRLSEFYLALWAELDDLSNEHRWVRVTNEGGGAQRAREILGGLVEENNSMEPLWREWESTVKLRDKWLGASQEDKQELQKKLEARKARLQELGLAYGAVAARPASQ